MFEQILIDLWNEGVIQFFALCVIIVIPVGILAYGGLRE